MQKQNFTNLSDAAIKSDIVAMFERMKREGRLPEEVTVDMFLTPEQVEKVRARYIANYTAHAAANAPTTTPNRQQRRAARAQRRKA